jgi:tetratricopeptide (TPR) repeat protein
MKKKFFPIFLIVLFILVILTPACDSGPPNGTSPSLLNVESHQATIAWKSQSPYKGIVRYTVAGSETDPLTAEERFGESQEHEVVLPGLEPGKTYTYWIGNDGPRFQFRTRPQSSSPFSFAFITKNSSEAAASLTPEVFDFIVCPGGQKTEVGDHLQQFHSRAPVFYTQGSGPKQKPSWFLDWGGLRLVFLNAAQELKPLLQSAAPYAFGIITSPAVTTNVQESPAHQQLVDYNKKNPHRPVAFVLTAGESLKASKMDGIHYLEIPSTGAEAFRVDVDVEAIRAISLGDQKEYTLREPPLGKERTCGECRRLADRGAYEESVAAYKQFIANNQGHFQVDDAIFSIAEIYDEKLFRFQEALDWYTRLTEEYPAGTLTPLAQQRIQYLRTYNDFDFIPLQRFERVRKVDFSRKGGQESAQLKLLEDVEALTGEYPACRLAPVMQLWLANRYRQFSVEKAVAALRQLRQRFPDSAEARDVSFEIGATYYQAGRYSEAIAALERALEDSPHKKKVIEGQIARSYRNIRRDIIAGSCWALLAILLILAMVSKPVGIQWAGKGKMVLTFIILTAIFVFAGYLIHEQFDSFEKMLFFAFWFALNATIAAMVSSSTAAKFFDGVFWRCVVGSLLGLLFFSAGFYLIVYYLNVHYLVLVTL